MPVGLDEHAQKFWRRYAGKLKTLGLLSEIDLDLLTMGAQWFSIHTRAVAELKDSLIQVSEANGRVARPEIAIAKQAAAIVRAVLAEFGIGPASRSKVSAIPTELDDPVEAYKRKHSARRFLA
jgi:P27 family predicted phage terminase small subunit